MRDEIGIKKDERIASLVVWILDQRQERRGVEERKEGTTQCSELIWVEDQTGGSGSLLGRGRSCFVRVADLRDLQTGTNTHSLRQVIIDGQPD